MRNSGRVEIVHSHLMPNLMHHQCQPVNALCSRRARGCMEFVGSNCYRELVVVLRRRVDIPTVTGGIVIDLNQSRLSVTHLGTGAKIDNLELQIAEYIRLLCGEPN